MTDLALEGIDLDGLRRRGMGRFCLREGLLRWRWRDGMSVFRGLSFFMGDLCIT